MAEGELIPFPFSERKPLDPEDYIINPATARAFLTFRASLQRDEIIATAETIEEIDGSIARLFPDDSDHPILP